MKKRIMIFVMSTIVGYEIQAQQWNGVTTATGSIYRTGNVGIGPETTFPGYASLYLSNGGGLNPNLMFKNSDASVDNRVWSVMAQGGRFRVLTQTDNGGSVQDAFMIERNGVNVTTVLFPKGFVGIGATTPNANLHISGTTDGKGELRLEADTDNNNENDNPFISFIQDGNQVGGYIGLVGDPNTAPHYPKYSMPGAVYTGTKSNALFIGTNFSENLQFGTNGNVRLTINESGNAIFKDIVAIGTPLTTNPNNYKLAVNGKIGAKEVQVENTSSTWADYVFEPTYKLRTLRELESFIQENKHLPEIPSAEEVKTNGHKLGEMDVLLLKKIEELTLYVIELEKKIDAIENSKK